jgi:ATP-dependent DNA helicase RecQ
MMRAYAETPRCRSAFLQAYFGSPVDGVLCGRCDNCVEGRATAETRSDDVPYAAQAPVRHPDFGEGTVTDVNDDRVTVLFDDVGYRTLSLDLVTEKELLELLEAPAADTGAA